MQWSPLLAQPQCFQGACINAALPPQWGVLTDGHSLSPNDQPCPRGSTDSLPRCGAPPSSMESLPRSSATWPTINGLQSARWSPSNALVAAPIAENGYKWKSTMAPPQSVTTIAAPRAVVHGKAGSFSNGYHSHCRGHVGPDGASREDSPQAIARMAAD